MDASGTPPPPIPPDERDRPRIGVDEWAAEAEARTERYSGLTAPIRRAFDGLPPPARLLLFVALAAALPLGTTNDFVIRVGVDTLLFALLALGLNIVVGWAGLLDLGYVAFYGFGAYGYAMLSSNQFHVHWPTWASIPVVVAASALLGFLVGLPSRRLVGDYLAIVTLFFGQIFVTVTTNGNRVSLLGFSGSHDITGGPNGIANIDPFNFLGHDLIAVKAYFYVALVTFALVIGGLYFASESRTGRAWRALREDSLAAELMGMPVSWLKLSAFAFGAATAGLTGTIFAALNTGVFASDFDVPLLITVYAMVILGGSGSLAGAAVGAILINVTLEVLRTPDHARWIFYGVIVFSLLAKLRPWRWLAVVLGGTVALGFAVHAIVASVWSRGTEGAIEEGGFLGGPLQHWLVLPSNPDQIGNYAFVGLIAAVIALTTLRGRIRTLALVPVLYLAAFVWENRLVIEPSITRLLLLGAVLIALMNARPHGLLGAPRVEIV